MQSDLIFDFGFHRGEDTDFYLKKGFRVIALEANPDLCNAARDRFPGPLSDGRLTLVNAALHSTPGEVTFFINDNSVWSTTDPIWAERNAQMGAPSRPVTVPAVVMPQMLARYGVPNYLKIDIEGADRLAVEGLASDDDRPIYVSVESDKVSFAALRAEIARFTELGYDRFKVVPQSKVPLQRSSGVDHVFPEGASGCFGEEAPGRWMTAAETVEAYRSIFWTYALVGDRPNRIAPRWAQSLAWRAGMRADWYDTHARRAGSTS